MIKPHQRLDVWKRSFQMVKMLYTTTKSFPEDEKYGMTSQIRRAAVSIPANIAEGAARNSKREFVRFLHISLGSASELDTLILLSKELDMIEAKRRSVNQRPESYL
jgi:four helix bundle protein